MPKENNDGEDKVSEDYQARTLKSYFFDDIPGGPLSFSSELIRDLETRAECLRDGKAYLRGVRSGFRDLDEMLGGLQEGRVTIIAARTSVGKTTFLLNIASNLAYISRVYTVFFSTEMSAKSLLERILAEQLEITKKRIQSRTISFEERERIFAQFRDLKEDCFYLNDSSDIPIQAICRIVKDLKEKHPVKVVFIDYVQKVSSEKSRQRYEEVGEVTRKLQAMAKELDVHVLCAAQISRNVDIRTRANSKNQPRSSDLQLSDLRESGNLEQDADAVIFLSEKEEISADEKLYNLTIAKNRHGRCGNILLKFFGDYSRFESEWRDGNEN